MIDLDNCREHYRGMRCLVPGCGSEQTCFAHHPRHRGMGGGHAGWAHDEGVPLCGVHHDAFDGRSGAIGAAWAEHLRVQHIVECLAPAFWARMEREAEAEREAMRRVAEADERVHA